MAQKFLGAHLIFEAGNEGLIFQGLMLARVDLFHEMLLGDHFASQFLSIGVVYD